QKLELLAFIVPPIARPLAQHRRLRRFALIVIIARYRRLDIDGLFHQRSIPPHRRRGNTRPCNLLAHPSASPYFFSSTTSASMMGPSSFLPGSLGSPPSAGWPGCALPAWAF